MRLETLLEVFENLPTKAKILVMGHNDYNILEDIYLYITYCQSPIEIIFLTALEIYRQEHDVDIFIQPQIEIEIDNKKYIADFEVEYDELCNPKLKKDFALVIECDGYEFHQKTKKQVEYDNKREYDLKINNYQILRFSGSEIYKDPIDCAERVFKYIEEKGYDR